MDFILGSTWLALHVYVTEHGALLALTALCAVGPLSRSLIRA